MNGHFESAPIIETARLIVRTFKESDADDLFEYLSLQEIYDFEPGRPITRGEAAGITFERATGNDFRAVELKDENRMIGHLYLNQLEPKGKMTWELGYIFNPKYHGQGFASEACRALVLFAFKQFGIHRMMARCNPKNTPSWKLLEGIGFIREAHFRKYGFFKRDDDGQPIWHDAYEYSMLEDDMVDR